MSDEPLIVLDDHRPEPETGPVPEGVKGLDMPLGRRVRLDGRGTTFVREIAVLGGEVDKFVSASVQQRLAEKVRSLGRE